MEQYLIGVHPIQKGLDNIQIYIFQQTPFVGNIFENQHDPQLVQTYLTNKFIGIVLNLSGQKINFELPPIQLFECQDKQNVDYYSCCVQLQKFYQSQPQCKNICIFGDNPEKSYSLLIAYCYYNDSDSRVIDEILMPKEPQFSQKIEGELRTFKSELEQNFQNGLLLRQYINIQSAITSSIVIEQKSSSLCKSDVQLTQQLKILDTDHQFISNHLNQQRQIPYQQSQFQKQVMMEVDLEPSQSYGDNTYNQVNTTGYSQKLVPQPFITKGTIGRNK